MSKYGETALRAIDVLESGLSQDSAEAWERAAGEIFTASESLREKGCPKGAFLGLCSEGLIQGLKAGSYGRPGKNGKYAIDAVQVLSQNRFLCSQPKLLWKKVAGSTKTENHQIEVVITLWESGHICA